MFDALHFPYNSVMLYNVAKLKQNIVEEDIELALGERCNTVKNKYSNHRGALSAVRFLNLVDLYQMKVAFFLKNTVCRTILPL